MKPEAEPGNFETYAPRAPDTVHANGTPNGSPKTNSGITAFAIPRPKPALSTQPQWETQPEVGQDDKQQGPIDDSVKQYLSDIRKYPLLTAEQEVTLAQQIKQGEASRRMLSELTSRANGEIRDLEHINKLTQKVKQGDEAREKFIKSNLRLVISIAKRYLGRRVSLLDLIQEGNMGLFSAVERYDPTTGYKFSTYASWWIRQAVTRAIAQHGRTIRIPLHVFEALTSIMLFEQRFETENGHSPTLEETSDNLGIPIKNIELYKAAVQATVSFDQPLPGHDEETATVGDFIEDTTLLYMTPETGAINADLRRQIEQALQTLKRREADILRLRFGISENGEDRPQMTFEAIGKLFGLTRENVRQIEHKALRKLRRRSETLRAY